MSLNNTEAHGKLQRRQIPNGDMQITAETMQTYDLWKFATALSYGSPLFEIPSYFRGWRALHEHNYSDKNGRVTEQRTANVLMSQTEGVV